MNIIHNAIQAIECGIEDFSVETDSRLKASIRNVHAGILLLFKALLSQLSPENSDEVLLKQRVLPVRVDGAITWKGEGRKTVDVQSIKERFRNLNIEVNWNNFDDINRIRNEIEHYYTTTNTITIREAIAKSFAIVSEFFNEHLKIDPKSKFSAHVWEIFVSVNAVYEREKASCESTYDRIDTLSEFVIENARDLFCDQCGSDLIFVEEDSTGLCRSCSKKWERDDLILAIVSAASHDDNVMAVLAGDVPAVLECPECGWETYLVEDDICAICGESQSSKCELCGGGIPIEEADGSGYCAHCDNMISKDD